MKYIEGDGHKPIKAWTDGVPVDEKAMEQVRQTASMPFIYKHMALMPDVHWGMGSTVGSVIATKGAIIPAAVGVDIGCGMMAVRLPLRADQLPDNTDVLHDAIAAAVPHGRSDGSYNDVGSWRGNTPNSAMACFKTLSQELQDIWLRHPKLKGANNPLIQAHNMLGTLGTGNHFIELCLDENDDVWIMLHSGSRGIGNRIGTYFISRAKEEMEKWCIELPNNDLAYLPEKTDLFNDYWKALNWAQNYAEQSRRLMMDNVRDAVYKYYNYADWILDDTGEVVECHHNYATRENHFGSNVLVTRKGAVCARSGTMGIIPGSMGDRSYIVRGLGNRDSFNSCSHGAGRVMSRAEARKTLTLDQHLEDTEGVSCKKDMSVIDESPKAYKPIDAVMEAQKDLVEVVHTLKQFVCVKG